ncbi:glycine cleavage system protein GcvH [Tessaracoccus sp. Y36]|uniref:glycine cleavage system protein GcvH n=1 Tax=Tessaracoccus sp. ZS01 TaxID=1906324 RepID=UPI0018E9E9A6|nr:glycine cleavage system protein GcvH [Tessaracoccus sp. ZS01]
MIKFTDEHEWVDTESFEVGITDHAASELGDIVFIDLPDAGTTVTAGEEIVGIDSAKAVSGINAPYDGEITEVNESLADSPESVTPHSAMQTWFIKIRPSDPAAAESLMDEDAYRSMIG